MSETWTAQNKNSLFKPQKLNGYEPYYGIEGNSLKSGCGFYIKDGINYKPRKDLDMHIMMNIINLSVARL